MLSLWSGSTHRSSARVTIPLTNLEFAVITNERNLVVFFLQKPPKKRPHGSRSLQTTNQPPVLLEQRQERMHSQILKYPSLFLDYICDQWKNLTPELQAVLLTQAAERELDVLAEGIIDTLFVECGLTPNETTVPIKTSQIASLVHSTSLRGYNLSFYCHFIYFCFFQF